MENSIPSSLHLLHSSSSLSFSSPQKTKIQKQFPISNRILDFKGNDVARRGIVSVNAGEAQDQKEGSHDELAIPPVLRVDEHVALVGLFLIGVISQLSELR